MIYNIVNTKTKDFFFKLPQMCLILLGWLHRHEALVLICGGSGIAPFISIIREIIFRSTLEMDNCRVPKVLLVAAFKNATDLAKLDLLLPVSSTSIDILRIDLQIEAYITREKEEPAGAGNDAHKLLQTTWFKPNPSDTPISAVLGRNSWLWLGAIILSSFLMFLLFLGILTRFWVYPIEKSGKVYHYSLKILWDMFLVCASVFLATSVIFLLQKRRESVKEGQKILNVEVELPTPMASPASLLSGREREVESAPYQYLVQSTKVHHGSRPDLKSKFVIFTISVGLFCLIINSDVRVSRPFYNVGILVNYQGSDVGVLVCGPRKMRHEVAKICSSGLVKNLHFESMSFNW